MKPNFALTLSLDGITLLHRAFPGWHLVGEVTLDSADLAGDLAELRKKALMLDPSGLHCKLVLPNDQIRFLSVDAPPDGTPADEAARAALDGATPYSVDDLAFDCTIAEDRLLIAAAARETLTEAEAFAIEHSFNPVCSVAMPETGDYAGEPYFGATQQYLAGHDDDSGIERDSVPIRVIGASRLPAPEHPPEESPASAATAEETGPVQADTESAGAAAAPPAEQPDSPEDPQEPARPAQENTPPPDSAGDEPTDTGDTGQTPAPEPVAAFTSIRASRSDGETAAPRLDGVVRDDIAPRLSLGTPDAKTDAEPAASLTGIPKAPPEISPRPEPATLRVTDSDRLRQAEPPEAAERPSFFTRRTRQKHKPQPEPARVPVPADERQRMTVFGAREPQDVGGKPRHLGLILTAALLLFLIAVATWASLFLDDGLAGFFRSETPPVVASLPQDPVVDATPDEEALDEEAGDEASVELTAYEPDEPVSVLDDPATEILSRVKPSDLSPDEAKARYAATGIWQLAPEPSATPAPSEFQDFYQTSLDPNPDFQDAVALPAFAASLTDRPIAPPAAPAPADTTYVLNARGFVAATEEGALTPDGVLVYAGRPPVVLPAFGARGDDGTADAPQDTLAPQVAALRPRARPADMAEQIERSELSGRTRNELAALRPKLRPQSAQEAAEAARAAEPQTPVVDGAAVDAAVAEAANPFAGATQQAVSASLKPNLRPRDFEQTVQRARRQPEPAQEQGVAVAASQKIAPRIPTSASVSKQATERNALKFKRVNLIGVYGTTSNRRALVRMSNGRYKKVQVGDRLDGGRVNAIGDSELSYSKGGRTVVLKMPRG